MVDLIKLCNDILAFAEHGDYSTGVEAGGIDEGNIRASEVLDDFRKRLTVRVELHLLSDEALCTTCMCDARDIRSCSDIRQRTHCIAWEGHRRAALAQLGMMQR